MATIVVEGLEEFRRDMRVMAATVDKEARVALRAAAEPVRTRAEDLAAGNIRNIGPVWSRMRLGVTLRVVYVAPRARRAGGSPRPNLGGLLMNEAMVPALEEKEPEVIEAMDGFIDGFTAAHGF